MKNLKKVLALVTMFTMLLSVAVSAGALYPDVEDNASYAEAVETLNVLGIMIGDEKGNFNPDASITRAETAAIVTRMKNLGNAATGSTNFTDVAADHWAAGYINLAEQSGIINGYGDGTFGPSDAVTYEQVIKMIVAALGRTPEAESKGGYPSGYMIVAAQEDITAGVTVTAGAEAPRAAVARLVFNALEVPVMEQDGFKTGEESFKVYDGFNGTTLKTLLKNYLKVNKYEGIITSSYLSNGNVDDEATINMECSKINEVSYKADDEERKVTLYEGETDAAAYLGYNVSAYAQLNEDDKMVLLGVAKKANRNEVVELAYTDIEKLEGNTLYYYASVSASKTEEIEVDLTNALRFYNGGNDKGQIDAFIKEIGKKNKDVNGILTLINNDMGEEYDVIMLNAATANHVVGAIDAEEMLLEDKQGQAIDLDLDDETKLVKFFKADGSVAEFADIAEGNVLTVYEAANENVFSVYISDVVVEGKVTELATQSNGTEVYTIGGNTYTSAKGLKVGDEGIFYVSVEGKIIDKVATATSGAYAYLFKAKQSSDFSGDIVEMKYLTSEGVWETTKLASKVTVVNGKNSYTVAMKDIKTEEKKEDIKTALKDFMVYNGSGELEHDATSNAKRLFQYVLNSDGDIFKLYIGDAGKNNQDYLSVDLEYDNEGRAYSASQKKIGQIFFNDETKIFSVKDTITEEKDIMLTKASALFIDSESYKIAAYDMESGIPAIAVVKSETSSILPGTSLLVITRVSTTTNSNGVEISKIYGMQEGQEVSGESIEGLLPVKDIKDVDYTRVIYEGTEDEETLKNAKALQPGDVVIFGLDASGAIDNVKVVMSYEAAKAAIGKNEALPVEGDKDDSRGVALNFFGYVGSKDNGLVWLKKNFQSNNGKMEDIVYGENDDDAAFLLDGSVNVYEINVSKTTPTFDIISASKIKAAKDFDKEAHWAYVRMYDDAVVDVVVYKTTTPEEVLPRFGEVKADGSLTITAVSGAEIYYKVNDAADFTKSATSATVTELQTGDVVSAYVVYKNVVNGVDTFDVTVPAAPVVD